MSDTEHPTQAIADMTTIKQVFGRLHGVKILYLGDGNNTTSALALAVAMTEGMRLMIVTPGGYGIPSTLLEAVNGLARQRGALVEQHHNVAELPHGFDVVYTTRWQTMGESKPDLNWREKFIPYRVTQDLMQRVSNGTGTIFMHDLPAVRRDDVFDEVRDGRVDLPESNAFLMGT
ncbi:MAG: hypothetical protein AABN95_01225 [Acidobacteriota bacterium]